MTFRLLGMSDEERLAFEEASGVKTEGARLIVEESIRQTEDLMARVIREVQEVVGPHGTITRVQAGGIRMAQGLGVAAFEDGILKTNIEPDGDFLAGADITQPASMSFAVFVNEQVYNNEQMGAGDILIGDNSTGVSNLKYDASEGQLQFRLGTTTNVYMDTDGSLKAGGGAVTIDALGITLLAGAYPATAYLLWKLSDGTKVGDISGWEFAAASESGIEITGLAKNSSYFGTVYLIAKDESGNNEAVVKVAEDNIHNSIGLTTPGAVNTRAFLISSYVSGTNAGNTVLYLDTYSSGTVANGLGTAVAFRIEDSAGGIETAGYMLIDWTDKTNGSEDAEFKLGLMKAGSLVDAFTVDPTTGPQANTWTGNTFTPVLAGTGTAGTGTYTAQLGRYTQIGNIVFFKIALIWTAHTGTGNMIITGLPVTSANTFSTPATVYFSNITLPAVGDKVQALIPANSAQINLGSVGAGAAADLALDTAGTLILAGFYMAQ